MLATKGINILLIHSNLIIRRRETAPTCLKAPQGIGADLSNTEGTSMTKAKRATTKRMPQSGPKKERIRKTRSKGTISITLATKRTLGATKIRAINFNLTNTSRFKVSHKL